jgi:hypothetical protein
VLILRLFEGTFLEENGYSLKTVWYYRVELGICHKNAQAGNHIIKDHILSCCPLLIQACRFKPRFIKEDGFGGFYNDSQEDKTP